MEKSAQLADAYWLISMIMEAAQEEQGDVPAAGTPREDDWGLFAAAPELPADQHIETRNMLEHLEETLWHT